MIDEKSISDQIHECKELLRGAEKSGTLFSEDFKVSCLIDKLPPSWSDFARNLRHKQGELTLTQAINSLRVEEKHKGTLPKPTENPPKVNIVENNVRNNNSKPRHFNNRNNFKPRRGNFKNNRFNQNRFRNQNQDHKRNQDQSQNQTHFNQTRNKPKGLGRGGHHCYVCGRTNHFAKNCYFKKTEPLPTQKIQRHK